MGLCTSGKISWNIGAPTTRRQVAPLERRPQRSGRDEVQRALVQRMAGGHGELRGVALEDGKPGGLRQRDDLRLGVGQRDPIADHQHRPLGAEQERGDLRHACRIDPPAPARVRGRLDVDVGLLVQRVHRQREEDRSLRGSIATLKARRRARGTSWAWWIWVAHLQTGRAMSTSGPDRCGS